MRRAVFIDRDGTLVREKHYLADPDQLELYPGSLEALRLLRSTGLALILVSNQSGVARGLFPEAQVAVIHSRLAAMLAQARVALDGVYYCPHHPQAAVAAYRRDCDCRKPRPGMLLAAARDHDLELAGSWVVGDKRDDIELGRTLGLGALLVRTGHGRNAAQGLEPGEALAVCDDLLAAARWICARETPS